MEKDRKYAIDKLDGVTPEEVEAYEAAGGKRAAKKAGNNSAAPAPKKDSPFGKK